MEKVLLYGSGDFGNVVRNILKYTNYTFAGFISDVETGKDILGDFNYLINNLKKEDYGLVITVGYSDLSNRMKLFRNVQKAGYILPNIIHSESRIDSSVILGSGNIIMSSTDIGLNSVFSDIAVVWPGSVVSHDSKIGSNVFLSPNCTLCGYTNIGSNSFIGAGSTIVDRRTVKENSFIKAGSIVK
jgi:sugar O-acyltransferase (sialic acid O-acetyltransferase NeuD family)